MGLRFQCESVPTLGQHPSLTAGPSPTEDSHQDAYYTCPVQIGTPAQTLHLNFDTGSADYWVRPSLSNSALAIKKLTTIGLEHSFATESPR